MEPPGRWARIQEPLVPHAGELAASAVEGLRDYFDRPFALFGHSLGALVAFEFARQVRRTLHLQPAHLFVAARRAPQLVPPVQHAAIHGLPDAAFLQLLTAHYGGMPQAVLDNPELLEIVLPITRADIQAVETYVYANEPPFDCPITAFGGRLDHTTSAEDLDAWRAQTTREASMRLLDGGHFFATDRPAEVLRVIESALRRLQG